jgi:hypothetical protein
MRRMQDRERKWRSRKRSVGRYKRELEYQRARIKRRRRRCDATTNVARHSGSATPRAVRNYRAPGQESLSCSTWKEVCHDDRETSAGPGPRAPPSS